METLFYVTLFVLFGFHSSYENLSRRKTTVLSQSSTYLNNKISVANDGILKTTQWHCSHTASNHSKAWFQVDLGKPFSINNVVIYYRREGNSPIDWKQYRFRQFYLDVSDLPANQTTTSQRTRCYTDNTTAPDLPPNIIDMSCKYIARYVIVETTYDAPEDYPYVGARLEICEIEVYGCGAGCVSGCDRFNGTCRCNPGWKTGGCEECDSKHYGANCTMSCNSHCKDGCCRKTGACSNCIEGRYGEWCNKSCGAGCVSGCDRFNGSCKCKLGWEGNGCIVPSIRYAVNALDQTHLLMIILPAVFSICFFLFLRHCLRKQCMRQMQQSRDNEENIGNHPSDSLETHHVIYENVRYECGYQNLSPLSEQSHPSRYDQLYLSQNQTSESLELNDNIYENVRTGSKDQKMDQHSEHSIYESILFK